MDTVLHTGVGKRKAAADFPPHDTGSRERALGVQVVFRWCSGGVQGTLNTKTL